MKDIAYRIRSLPVAALDGLARILWAAHGRGEIGDDQATEYADAIAKRRQQAGWEGLRRKSRRPDPSASVARRRSFAAAGVLPSELAVHFTLGEHASLAVVGTEFRRRGSCRLAVGAIAAIAGVCEAVVRSAVSKAVSLGILTRTERRRFRRPSLTNILAAVGSWATWLGRPGRVQFFSGHEYPLIHRGIQRPSDCAMPVRSPYSRDERRITGGRHAGEKAEADGQGRDRDGRAG